MFDELFNVSASAVIQAMDKANDDIPNQVPEHLVDLPAVGLHRKNVAVLIEDPFGSGSTCQLMCEIDTTTHVPASKRGIHTSRIGSAMASLALKVHRSLRDYTRELCEQIYFSEYGVNTVVETRGAFCFMEEVCVPVSDSRCFFDKSACQVPGWKEEKNKRAMESITLKSRCTQSR